MPESQLTLPLNDRIAASAHKLAVRFTEDADLPARFRRQTDSSVKPRKVKEDSDIGGERVGSDAGFGIEKSTVG